MLGFSSINPAVTLHLTLLLILTQRLDSMGQGSCHCLKDLLKQKTTKKPYTKSQIA